MHIHEDVLPRLPHRCRREGLRVLSPLPSRSHRGDGIDDREIGSSAGSVRGQPHVIPDLHVPSRSVSVRDMTGGQRRSADDPRVLRLQAWPTHRPFRIDRARAARSTDDGNGGSRGHVTRELVGGRSSGARSWPMANRHSCTDGRVGASRARGTVSDRTRERRVGCSESRRKNCPPRRRRGNTALSLTIGGIHAPGK